MNKLDKIKDIIKNKINEGLTTNIEFEKYIQDLCRNLSKEDIEYLLDENYICECDGREHEVIKNTLNNIKHSK